MFTASEVNACELVVVSARLRDHMRSFDKSDPLQFANLCISLARCIDYALASSEVPKFDLQFPTLLKQICEHRSDCALQAAIMVLMISVKTACKNGWFLHNDSKELQTLAHEIGSAFCCTIDMKTDMSSLEPTITTIMSRFYPQMKIDQILTSLAVKPGYEAYMMDFQIPKNLNVPQDVWLFVAEIDNLETSACIISPQQVNFLLNGKGVESRSNILMDNGPQLPTNVTKLLKHGTNLLQAVGQYNGNYVIMVARMSLGKPPVRPILQDYVQPTVALLDSDTDLTEGPSRVSLSCPISMKRIRIPVKGVLCKHHQSFDLDNYVDMNLRRPSWRCPHCNQTVCFNDIRIDQKMVKILEDVGVNVAAVMISADGSWKAATESNNQSDTQHEETSNCTLDDIVLPQCTVTNRLPPIMDLTEEVDVMDIVSDGENECVNPLLAHKQDQLSNPCTKSTNVINQSTPLQFKDCYGSGVYLPIHGSETSDGRIDAQVNAVSVSAPTSHVSPVLTDAISPALSREPDSFHAPPLAASDAPSQSALPVNTPVQQFSNFDMVNEYVRFPTTSINTNSVQGLPVQASPSILQQRPINASQICPNPLMVNSSNPVFSNVERRQQPMSHLSSYPGAYMSLSSLQQQSWGQQGQFSPSQPSQPITPTVSSRHPRGYRVPTVPVTDGHNLHQQSIGQRMLNIRSPSPSLVRSSVHGPPTQSPHGGLLNRVTSTPPVGQQPGQSHRSAQQASQLAGISSQMLSGLVQEPPIIRNVSADSRPLTGNTGGTIQPATPEVLVDMSAAGQEWRPTGRMRGSLSGAAYSAALNQFITQPAQPVQTTRPLTNVATSISGIPYPQHVLKAMSMNPTTEALNMSTPVPTTRPSTNMATSISGIPYPTC
ncbi:E4 SUMO-protein ligase PIAL2 isoform X2 [Daucus carota subsp. sativus]|uniref:E4 SUMO-protein ligase PIAL2 isoform X2 n=1 Tax=Daucus carota subsp. sativus TaxID=79200 RepID=UPI0007EFF5C3|nr:PREDICTED: E4 SUMO-protein ligase PIAL2 isoform X2 [Daucus carota subsp. sativus]